MMMNVRDKAGYVPPDIMKPYKMTASYEHKPDDPHEVKPRPRLPRTPIYRPKTPTIPDAFTTPVVDKDAADSGKTSDGGTRRLTVNIGRKAVDIETVTEREMELIKRAEELQADLVLALGATEDIAALKTKLKDVVDKLAQEKIWRADLITDNKKLVNKQEMFIDHIEKLSFQLKHIAIAKMKEKGEAMKVREENKVLQKKILKQKRWAKSAKKCIEDLKSNNKLLNGQLTIMDENYLRIRLALDAAKNFQNKQVNDAVQESHELRVKYASASGKMLDEIYLPPDSPYIEKVRNMDRRRRRDERNGQQQCPETSESLESFKLPTRPTTAGAERASAEGGRRNSKDESVYRSNPHGQNRPNTAGNHRPNPHTDGTKKQSQKLGKILTKISQRKTESTENPEEIWSTDRLNKLLAKTGLHHDPPTYKPV